MTVLGFAVFKELPILSDGVGIVELDRKRVHVHLGLVVNAARGIEIELERFIVG